MDSKEIILSQIGDLSRALLKLSEALHSTVDSEIIRDGTIQRFEFSFELCWKLLKSVNTFLGTECFSPRDCVRIAAQNEIIDDPEKWFEYIKMRNFASHTYNEKLAEEIYNKIPDFEKAANTMLHKIEQKIIDLA